MNTREIASEYRLGHWAGVLQERRERGISVKEFCRRSGFQENVYYYWQRKLREAACEELAVRAQNEVAVSQAPHVPDGWAVCKRVQSACSKGSLVVEVGGCRVRVEPETDLVLLAKVCQALQSPC